MSKLPAFMVDINLLPAALREARRAKKATRTLNLLGVGVFILAFILALGLLSYSWALSGSKTNLERQIAREEEKIRDLKIIERDAHKLETKAAALEKILKVRASYSRLLEMLAASTPPEVVITELVSAPGNTVNVSGSAQSYIALARFLLKVLDEQAGGGELFETADLTSVGLDKKTGRAKFVATLYFREGGLVIK